MPMKSLLLIIYCLLLVGCARQAAQTNSNDVNSVNGPPIATNSNHVRNYLGHEVIMAQDIPDHLQRLNELAPELEKFKIVPIEFSHVDFKNFYYESQVNGDVRLKNGEYDESKINPEVMGNFMASLGGVYYVDLVGDNRKEAIVVVWYVGCGGSCDGGSQTIYLFSGENPKPKLLGQIETGCRSCGCFLRSLEIRNKKIILSQFGRCKKTTYDNENDYKESICKFCTKDLTSSIYSFNGRKLVKESTKVIDSTYFEIANYITEISIVE